ncbi:cell wall-binding repeat-containing protein [Desulfosporosinus sp. BICA1-9]|uniref:cell wall-binding repeat-containing protein n=1 Tax=Desulfosporosinus sp. BICA1-9 TaxID=1531958 RepID=UPI0025BB824B|nr:cell wall-binding repeat-containing protein [Desulfosporosinus sp. BICA1-9]
MTAQKVSSTIVVGGSYVIPEAITQRLPGVVRYAGSDRYATSTAIAQGLTLNTDRVYVVTGLNFADALTAGNLAAHSFSPVIMVDNTIPEARFKFLNRPQRNNHRSGHCGRDRDYQRRSRNQTTYASS